MPGGMRLSRGRIALLRPNRFRREAGQTGRDMIFTADDLSYTVRRSDRRTLAVQVKNDGSVLVRTPMTVREADIGRFVLEKADWIRAVREKQRRAEAAAASTLPLTTAELAELRTDAVRYFSERVPFYAQQIGTAWGKVTIRCQKTRWGSCSSAGNLNFNCLLMLAPAEVRDYVIVHELCHRLEMNHSARFWAQVERVMPDWRRRQAWLRENGAVLLRRAEQGGRQDAV